MTTRLDKSGHGSVPHEVTDAIIDALGGKSPPTVSSVTFREQVGPDTPPPGSDALFFDSADGTPKYVDDQGVVTTVGSGGAGTVQIAWFEFVETAGAGTYTASVDLPARSSVLGFVSKTLAAWDADHAVIHSIGDSDAPGSWWAVGDDAAIKTADTGWMWSDFQAVRSSVVSDGLGVYPDGTTITVVVTTDGVGGTTGRTYILMSYSTASEAIVPVKT